MVRKDIPVSNQIPQIGHACLLAGSKFNQPEEPSNIVILQVDNEAKLLDAADHAKNHGIDLVWFDETEYPLGINAFCTAPIDCDSRRAFRKFKLWK